MTTADERIWYLYTAEGQQGPYTAEEIRAWLAAGQITAEWHVWREGLANWQTIGQTPDLAAPPAAPAPPPPPPKGEAPKKTEEPAKKEEKPAKKKTAAAGWRPSPAFLAILGLLLFGVGGVYGAAYLFPTLLPEPLVIALGMKPAVAPPPAPAPGVEIRSGPPGLLGDLPAGAAWGVHLKGAGGFVGRIARSEAWLEFARSQAGRRALAGAGKGDSTPLDLLDPLLAEEAAAAAYVDSAEVLVLFAGRGEMPSNLERALAAGGPAEAVEVGGEEARRFPIGGDDGGGPTHVWALERDGVVYLAWQGEKDELLHRIVEGGDALRADAAYVAAGEEIPDGAILWGFVDGERAAPAVAAAAEGLPGLTAGAPKPSGTYAFAAVEREEGVEVVIVSRGGTPPPARELKTLRHAPATAIAFAASTVDPAAEEMAVIGEILSAAAGNADIAEILGGEIAFALWTERNATSPRFGFLLEARDEKAAMDLLEGLLRKQTADLDPARVRRIGGVEARIVKGPMGGNWALGALGDGVVALASDADALVVLAEAPSKGNLATEGRLEVPDGALGAVLVDLDGMGRVLRAFLDGFPMSRDQRAEARAGLDLVSAVGEVRGYTVADGEAVRTTLHIGPRTP